MAVLVTGGLGVVGSWVGRALVQMGERPVLLDNRYDESLIQDIKDKVTVVIGDITDIVSLLETVAKNKVDKIIHTAALLVPKDFSPHLFQRVNIGGTVNILEVARLTGIKRVVYNSSKGVYGRITGEYAYPKYLPVKEDHFKPDPEDLYEACKLTSEYLCKEYHDRYRLECLITRFAFYYGPGKVRHGAHSIHTKLIGNAMKGIPTHVASGRDERHDLIYIGDVARGVVKAVLAKNPKDSAFNIGTGKGVSLADFADVLRKIYPKSEITVGPGLDFMGTKKSHYCILDITRAREQLDYEPTYDLEAGIKDYIKKCQDMGLS